MKKKLRELVLDFDEFPLVLEIPGFLYQWCCECGCRHAWYFALTEKNNLWIDCGRDEMAEKLRKFHEQETKKRTKSKKTAG